MPTNHVSRSTQHAAPFPFPVPSIPLQARRITQESLQLQVHGPATAPTLVYLPGLHGDWTLLPAFRAALGDRARLAAVTYPRRADWLLPDYARAVEASLLTEGIERAWLIGESFSSQVAWAFLEARPRAPENTRSVQIEGLILAGGFVRHSFPWGVRLAHRASAATPSGLLKFLCGLYGNWAGRRSRNCAEVRAGLDEFVTRRLVPSDRLAINSRYQLIAANDPRPIAAGTRLPVFHLTGALDPIVPWPQVRSWLRRHCPGYRGSRVVWSAGHNVLLSAPGISARQILEWTAPARADF